MNSSLKLASFAALAGIAMASDAEPARSAEPAAYTTLAENKLLDFRYSFPTIVGSYPALLAQLRSDREKSHSEALEGAREDSAFRADNKFPFHPHEFWRDWTTTGETARLLGLECRTDFFTGGAHPNHTSAWLPWDKERHATIGLKDLFVKGGYWTALKGDYCRELVKERLHRGSPGTAPCPSADEVTVELLDIDLDWRFETVRIIADPYVAGSYAEGTYAVTLPVTEALIALARPEYRPSFEAQRQ